MAPSTQISQETCLYFLLDGANKIIEIGGHTLDDIEQSGANFRVTAVGTPFFDHVVGHFTKRFLKEFLTMVRVRKAEARRMYRCDSPTAKRLMEMRAIPLSNSGLRLEHRAVKEEPLPHRVDFQTVHTPKRAAFVRCSSCNNIRPIRGGEWLEPDTVSAADSSVPVVYSICPDCRDAIKHFQPPAG